jgi:hypothetical protein
MEKKQKPTIRENAHGAECALDDPERVELGPERVELGKVEARDKRRAAELLRLVAARLG